MCNQQAWASINIYWGLLAFHYLSFKDSRLALPCIFGINSCSEHFSPTGSLFNVVHTRCPTLLICSGSQSSCNTVPALLRTLRAPQIDKGQSTLPQTLRHCLQHQPSRYCEELWSRIWIWILDSFRSVINYIWQPRSRHHNPAPNLTRGKCTCNTIGKEKLDMNQDRTVVVAVLSVNPIRMHQMRWKLTHEGFSTGLKVA